MATSVASNGAASASQRDLVELVTYMLSPIGYQIRDEIFQNYALKRGSQKQQKELKDRIFRQITLVISKTILEKSHDLEQPGMVGTVLHTKIGDSIADIVCSVLPSENQRQMRLDIMQILERITFPNFVELQAILEEKLKMQSLVFPHAFLELFPMEGEMLSRLGEIFQGCLSKEGSQFLEEEDSLGENFTIHHIAEEKREVFAKDLFSLCYEFMYQTILDRTPVKNFKETEYASLAEKQINRYVTTFIKQLSAGIPLLELIERTNKFGQGEIDRMIYDKAKEVYSETDAKHFVTQKRLERKAKISRAVRMEREIIESVVTWAEWFNDKSEEELEALAKGEAKLPHEKAEEELLEMLRAEKEEAACSSKKKKRGKKRKAGEMTVQPADPSPAPKKGEGTRQKCKAPKKVETSQKASSTSKEERLPTEELVFINQMANNHALLEKRVARWGELSVDEIKRIPGYQSIKDPKQALEIQARHHLRGVHALLQSDRLRQVYTFPCCYKDKKGKSLSGRGILAALHYGETTQFGVVYVGWDEESGKIYHAFLEVQPNENRSSLDKLLRPKIYQYFQKGREEAKREMKESDWQFVSHTTFEPVESEKTALKMIQADISGQEILHYIFYPIR